MTDIEALYACEWCGDPLTAGDGVWTHPLSGDYCPEGLAVGRTGTSPHLPVRPGWSLVPTEELADPTLVLELLDRAVLTTEDETEWRDHSEGIRGAIKEGGLRLAIQRQLDFETSLDADEEGFTEDTYGEFPASLRAALEAKGPRP